jgi:hypothetical protein
MSVLVTGIFALIHQQSNTYMKYVHEVTQIGDAENPTDEALEASEAKMFSLAALLKTIGTVCSIYYARGINDAERL